MSEIKITFEDIQNEIAAMLELSGNLDSEQMAVMDNYLNDLAGAESDKIDGFARFIRSETGRMDFLRDESDRLARKRKSIENRIKYLKAKYAEIMRQGQLKQISGNVYKLSLRISEAVSIEDTEALPMEYTSTKTEVTPNKTAIKSALQQGIKIPGCSIVQNASLQIG